MKILGLTSGAYFFGKERVTINVGKGLLKNGHTVRVFFNGWHDGVFQQKLTEIGVEAYPLKLGWYYMRKVMWSLDSLVHYPKALYQYLEMQRRFRPDVIYVDSYRPVVLLKPFLKGRLVYHVNDPHTEGRMNRLMLRLVKSKVDRFIAASEFIKRDLVAMGVDAGKITVVYNAIEIPGETGKEYMPQGILRIGIVGQVIPRKGHEDLIKACALIKKEVPFALYIFGTGQAGYTEYIRKMIADYQLTENVHWMGYANSTQDMYSQLDLLVAPTRNEEPFGLVAVEAGTFKVPSIATKSGGLPEIVINGTSGFVVQKESPEQIAEKIKFLFHHPDVLKAFGQEARKVAVQNFSTELMHEKMEEALKVLV